MADTGRPPFPPKPEYPQGNEGIQAAGWEPFPTTLKPDDIVFLTGEKPDLARFSGIVNEHVLLVNGDIDFMAPHPKNRPLSLDNARSICPSITTEIWVSAENPMTGIANGPFVSNGTTHPISSITGKSVQTWLLKGSHHHLALWMVLLTNPAHPKLWQIKVLPSWFNRVHDRHLQMFSELDNLSQPKLKCLPLHPSRSMLLILQVAVDNYKEDFMTKVGKDAEFAGVFVKKDTADWRMACRRSFREFKYMQSMVELIILQDKDFNLFISELTHLLYGMQFLAIRGKLTHFLAGMEPFAGPHLNALGAGMAEGVTFGMLLRPVPAAKQQIINTALQAFETTGAEQLAAVGCGGGGGGLEQHIATTKAVFVLIKVETFWVSKNLSGYVPVTCSQHINLKSKMWDDRLIKFLDKAVLAHWPNIISKIYRDGQSFLTFDPKGLPKATGNIISEKLAVSMWRMEQWSDAVLTSWAHWVNTALLSQQAWWDLLVDQMYLKRDTPFSWAPNVKITALDPDEVNRARLIEVELARRQEINAELEKERQEAEAAADERKQELARKDDWEAAETLRLENEAQRKQAADDAEAERVRKRQAKLEETNAAKARKLEEARDKYEKELKTLQEKQNAEQLPHPMALNPPAASNIISLVESDDEDDGIEIISGPKKSVDGKRQRLVHQFTMLTSSLNEEQVNVLGQNLAHAVNTAISIKRLASSLSLEEDEQLVVNPPKRVQVTQGKGTGTARALNGRRVQKVKQSEDEEREVQSEDEEEDDDAKDAQGGGPSQPSKASARPHPVGFPRPLLLLSKGSRETGGSTRLV
ncbi:hypothetical protein B0H11DRAFT_2195282 [Mycena galericulata]|nr:hypothetical protein B0H11DRAFT_2195282 [Mycena galericulata]